MWVNCTCSLQLLSFQHSFTHQFSGLSFWHSVRWSRNVSKMYSDSHHREVVSVQLKVMLGFSKECQNVPYFCRLVTWRLRQCLDILFKGVSTVSEAPSFDTTCYTAWNIQLTRGAGLGLASEHLDLLLSEDVKIGRDRKLSKTDRVCEYDDMIYIYIFIYT